jgi:galactose-1-phosphate uridylyltransferase
LQFKEKKMPELRKDPVIDRWVIISTERGKRPVFFVEEAPLQVPAYVHSAWKRTYDTP